MDWVVFAYSLPSKHSSPRVTLWRRLRRRGVISPTGGVSILPARDDCIEAFHWLAEEIRQAEGDALVMRVQRFDGLSDQQVIELFREARRGDYAELDAQLAELEAATNELPDREALTHARETLARLRRQHADIVRIDYFDSPEGVHVAARRARLEATVAPQPLSAPHVASATLDEYRGRRWVTRPRPHVDRLACAWLIRRFIDPTAAIRYADQPEPEEVAFDMSGAQFGHTGNLCTFETMLRAFGLNEPALVVMAEIVHEIDLRDGRSVRPEIAGIDLVLNGWLLAGLADADLEGHGMALFEGLYTALRQQLAGLRDKEQS
ncbi:MAG TPA: chromate resistance protein ChrB domain-containing protein [Ardenticatenaceae bacterium]|nr:chromate resistance protein ChrB domain-containing protein [Ardenticatenaceae bacterium]